jgi:hypothetical protein
MYDVPFFGFQNENLVRKNNSVFVLCTALTFMSVKKSYIARFEVFMAVRIQVEIFWVMMLRSAVVRYQCFGGPYCLHLQLEDGGSTVL